MPDRGEHIPGKHIPGTTICLDFCEVCPPLWNWPHKHLILGTCPDCGKVNEKAWRLAKAHCLNEARP